MKSRQPPDLLPAYDKVHVGRRLMALRSVRRMGRTEWANSIGERCTPQKICNYENGDDQLPVAYAARVCVLTGASFDYIYRGITKYLPRNLLASLASVEAGGAPAERTSPKKRGGGQASDRA